jgi:hypothetical protein
VPGPVTDPRAGELLGRYRELFGGPELPVPVDAIAEDLLGLSVEERELEVSGMLLPAERRILVNAGESEPRQRFTIAHELGHWVCQCLDGTTAPVFCRDKDVSAAANRGLEREANVFAAELLMPRAAVIVSGDGGSERFGVSKEAFAWRLHSFDLGPAPAFR